MEDLVVMGFLEEYFEHFPNRVREFRVKKELTAIQLAGLLGPDVTITDVLVLERQGRLTGRLTKEAVARVLGESVEVVFPEDRRGPVDIDLSRKHWSLNFHMNSKAPPNRIREFRLAYNMTLKDLANLLNRDPSTISYYETGARRPNHYMSQKIASIFGCAVEDVFPPGSVRKYTLEGYQKMAVKNKPSRLFILVPKKLFDARNERDWTLETAARIIGISYQTLWRLEHGAIYSVRKGTFDKVVAVYGRDVIDEVEVPLEW